MSPERQINYVIGAIVGILLIGLGALIYNNIAARNAEADVNHSREVESAITSLIAATLDVETGYRGFIITGQDPFLDPFVAGARDTPVSLARLRALTADNPEQRVAIERLSSLLDRKMALGNRAIALRRTQGAQAAAELIAVGDGKMLMDAIRDTARQMQTVESGLLATHARAAAVRRRQLAIASTAVGLILVVAIAALMIGLRRQTIARELLTENLRQTEVTLRLSLEQLARSNRDLQDFAMVASHDLQEPLRKVQMFGDRLREELGTDVGAQAIDYLTRMQGAADRGQTLIRGLLAYSRVTSQAQAKVEVSLETIGREVLSDLEGRLVDSGGRVELGALPVIEADAVQMRQLLQNLIGNALKFRRPGVAPLIQVSSRPLEDPRRKDWWQIEVADNGIGFDEKYLDRIFKIFQRLHERGVYEGAGMGLAICRRIVENHGGTLTARSVPGEGSTFIIQLPAQQASKEALS